MGIEKGTVGLKGGAGCPDAGRGVWLRRISGTLPVTEKRHDPNAAEQYVDVCKHAGRDTAHCKPSAGDTHVHTCKYFALYCAAGGTIDNTAGCSMGHRPRDVCGEYHGDGFCVFTGDED